MIPLLFADSATQSEHRVQAGSVIHPATVTQMLADEPWLVVCILVAVVVVACVAIVFITDYLRKSHQAEIDMALKQDMLNRGLSAADIKTVLEASSNGEACRLALADQGVRVGLGKFQVEVGSVNRNGANPAEATAQR